MVVQAADVDDGNMLPFWVGKVVKIKKNEVENYVRTLLVRWYDNQKKKLTHEQRYAVPYYPCYLPPSSRANNSKKQLTRSDLRSPLTDDVDTDAVSMTFSSLNKNNCLPLAVQKKLLVLAEGSRA